MTAPRRCPHCEGHLFQEVDMFLMRRPFLYLLCVNCGRDYGMDGARLARNPMPVESQRAHRESAVFTGPVVVA
jgi:hypothetical protein